MVDPLSALRLPTPTTRQDPLEPGRTHSPLDFLLLIQINIKKKKMFFKLDLAVKGQSNMISLNSVWKMLT